MWCFSEETALPERQLSALRKNIRYHKWVPQEFSNKRGKPSLKILDDLLNHIYSEVVWDLFTKGSHHQNISVILITQNLFRQGRNCRDISLNAKYLALLKNRDKNQVTYLARQVYPEHSGSLYNAYLESSQKPHGYVILDFTQDMNDLLRFRTNIFPDEYPPLIYAPGDNEANKVELPHASNLKKRKD
jgi:hypothetical protein